MNLIKIIKPLTAYRKVGQTSHWSQRLPRRLSIQLHCPVVLSQEPFTEPLRLQSQSEETLFWGTVNS